MMTFSSCHADNTHPMIYKWTSRLNLRRFSDTRVIKWGPASVLHLFILLFIPTYFFFFFLKSYAKRGSEISCATLNISIKLQRITAGHGAAALCTLTSATAGRLGRQQTRAMWIHSRRYILPLRGAGLSDRAIVHGTSKSVGDS